MEHVIGKLKRLDGPALTLTILTLAVALWLLLAFMFAFGGSMIRSAAVNNEVKIVPCSKCVNCTCPRVAGTAQCLCPR